MTTVKRLTTWPLRSVNTPQASMVPVKYVRKSSSGFSCAYCCTCGPAQLATKGVAATTDKAPKRLKAVRRWIMAG